MKWQLFTSIKKNLYKILGNNYFATISFKFFLYTFFHIKPARGHKIIISIQYFLFSICKSHSIDYSTVEKKTHTHERKWRKENINQWIFGKSTPTEFLIFYEDVRVQLRGLTLTHASPMQLAFSFSFIFYATKLILLYVIRSSMCINAG